MKRLISISLALLTLVGPLSAIACAAEGDIDWPQLVSYSVEHTEVAPGGRTDIAIGVRAEQSVPKAVSAVFVHEQGSTAYTVALHLDTDDDEADTFAGTFYIPKNAPQGYYRLARVIVEDRDENVSVHATAYEDDNEEQGRFALNWDFGLTVLPGAGTAAPASCSVALTDGTYRLTFRHSGTGDFEKATLLFVNGDNHRKIAVSVGEDHAEATGLYRRDIAVSRYEPSGIFTLKEVVIRDRAGGQQTYNAEPDTEDGEKPLTFSASFYVNTAHMDTAHPVLRSVSVGSGVRDAEDEVTRYPITATVADDLSGVDYIILKFKNPGGESISKVLRAADYQNGVYTGRLKVDFDRQPGIYVLNSVAVCDRAGNRMTYCVAQDLSDRKLLLPVTASVSVNS